jgi:hypothetical protein
MCKSFSGLTAFRTLKLTVCICLGWPANVIRAVMIACVGYLIRGGSIFSVSNSGDYDHGMNTTEITSDEVDDNLYDATKSLDRFLSPMQQLSTLQDIRNFTHLRTLPQTTKP